MTTTASAELASGRWTVDLAHSTATFRVSNLGRTVTGTVPIIEGVVDITADSVTAAQAGWSVAGRLTARGATVRVAGHVEVSGQDRSAALTAHTWLDRRILGVRAPRIMIGHRIDIIVTAAIRRVPDQ